MAQRKSKLPQKVSSAGTREVSIDLVDVGRGAKNHFLAVQWLDFPLNHNKQKCKMFPNNNHVEGTYSLEILSTVFFVAYVKAQLDKA